MDQTAAAVYLLSQETAPSVRSRGDYCRRDGVWPAAEMGPTQDRTTLAKVSAGVNR